MHRALLSTAGAILISTVLWGCQNNVADTGVYYNEGLAEASNNLLLTNIIRSAKGYPNYYTLVGDYSGSLSTSIGGSLSGSIPLDDLGESSLSVSTGPDHSVSRNASASSLETQDFTRAMHTEVSEDLMLFLITSFDEIHTHLIFIMLIKSVTMQLDYYTELLSNARSECERRASTLSGSEQGICRNLEQTIADVDCDFERQQGLSRESDLITLRNFPNNECAFTQFRLFSEVVMLNRGRAFVDKSGKFNIRFADSRDTMRQLYGAEGTGVKMRSPYGVIQFIGEIVRAQYRADDAWTPVLSSRDGRSRPIFTVETGNKPEHVYASAVVDEETFFVRSRNIDDPFTDFSERAMAIIKNLQALNTGRDELPTVPTIILGPGVVTQ
ncbi:MAG: hypothetical protein AAGF57_06510 [Pseudomonadota bacterium]